MHSEKSEKHTNVLKDFAKIITPERHEIPVRKHSSWKRTKAHHNHPSQSRFETCAATHNLHINSGAYHTSLLQAIKGSQFNEYISMHEYQYIKLLSNMLQKANMFVSLTL